MGKSFVITQGEYRVSDDPTVTITTILGSCVGCCLWDPLAKVGGMNHILIASDPRYPKMSQGLAGINAMELLINDLLKLGATRSRLLAKAFGGASTIKGLSNIGSTNSVFATEYLRREGITCIAKSLGGDVSRRVIFEPTTGAARVRTQTFDEPAMTRPMLPEKGNAPELF